MIGTAGFKPQTRAVNRVKNPLPAPDSCRYCGASVRVVSNAVIYGRAYGNWPWAFRCAGCGAYVGMHPYTAIPLGTLANRALRRARNESKRPFEALWRQGAMDRDEAYLALATHLGIEVQECHFGWFEHDQCERALEWATDECARWGIRF